MELKSFILTTHCPDKPGIISAITTAIFESGGNILDAQQFDDALTTRFFSRTAFSIDPAQETKIRESLLPVFGKFEMEWTLHDQLGRPKVIIMASKYEHCLGELLYRWQARELKMEVVGVVSNYPIETYHDVPGLTEVPFFYFPITPETKQEQENQIWDLFQKTSADLVVLARYMQIISDDLATKLAGRCINIHHSFLPSFKGAKPYHQAYERGVKLIGATAHYVTADLDEGPIIEQGVERISHRETPEDLTRKGREIERMVLARAVRYHLDDRVLLNGHRTVVFPE